MSRGLGRAGGAADAGRVRSDLRTVLTDARTLFEMDYVGDLWSASESGGLRRVGDV